MECRILIIWCFCFLKIVSEVASVDLNTNTKLETYLDVKYDLKKYLLQQTSELLDATDLSNIETEYTLQQQAQIFSFDDDIYLLLGNKIYYIVAKNNTYNVVDTKFVLNKIDSDNEKDFLKTCQFGNIIIMLVKLKSGAAQIYKFSKGSIEFLHSIFIPESKDAHFFINNRHLYLVVINSKGKDMAITSIYKLVGSHFDEIQTIFTIGAIKVATFRSGKSQIIIILRISSHKRACIDVFEFKEEKITKIQQINTGSSRNLNAVVDGGHYFVVVHEHSDNSIFQWKGYQLHRTPDITTDYGLYNIVSEVYNGSVMLSSHQETTNIPFGEKQTSLLEIYKGENGSAVISSLVYLTEDKAINMRFIFFKIKRLGWEVESGYTENIRECFDNLELNLYEINRKQYATIIQNRMAKQDPSLDRLNKSLEKIHIYDYKIKNVEEKLNIIKSSLSRYTDDEGYSIIINESVVFKEIVEADNILGKKVEIQKLNDKKWVPGQWFKIKEPQTVLGPLNILKLVTKHLEISPDDTVFQDLLLKNGDQIVLGKIAANKIISNKMYTKTINNILLIDMHLNHSKFIKGTKLFKTLETEITGVENINAQISSNSCNSYRNFDSNLIVENLEINNINNISWNKLKKSSFKVDSSDIINGDLFFGKLKLEQLASKTLRNVEVHNFLTESTNQVIAANVEFIRLYAKNISANTVNSKNLHAAVFLDEKLPIKAVTFNELNTENLTLMGTNRTKFAKTEDHITDTNGYDFLQIYNAKVKIDGNLTLKNITMLPQSHLLLSGEVLLDINTKYWTKNTDQEIPVKALAKNGMKVPHILITRLNDVKFDQYMQTNVDNTFETDFNFENITVWGHVLLTNMSKNNPDFTKLSKESIKINGSYIITGRKTYIETLKTENLVTTELDGINTFEALNRKWPINVSGKKTFENLLIKKDFKGSIEHVDILNDKAISEWNASLIGVNNSLSINTINMVPLHFKDLEGTNLLVKNINGHPVEDYVSKLNFLRATHIIKNLIIHQRLRINNVNNVSTINEIKFEELLNKSKSKLEKVGSITLDVMFTGKIKMENLATNIVNDIDLKNLTSQLLYRSGKQSIMGPCKFGKIKTEAINTTKVNEISMNNVIDIRSQDPQQLIVPKGVVFTSAEILKFLNSNDVLPCNTQDLTMATQNPRTQNWNELKIIANVRLWDETSLLYRVFEKTVKSSVVNIISSQVIFMKNVSARNIYLKMDVNNTDILKIVEDAVLRKSQDGQIIAGGKWFVNIRTNHAIVKKNADVLFVNNEDIDVLNKDIVDHNITNDIVIRGVKTFYGSLQADRFYSKTVNNVKTENIVNLENTMKVPAIMFDVLKTSNLNISFINLMNLTHILENRLLLRGPANQKINAIYFFKKIEVENMTTPTINKVAIDDVIFDKALQIITGRKYFFNKIVLSKGVYVDLVNGIDISKEYENSIIDSNIKGSITVLPRSSVNGSLSTEYINGFPVPAIFEILRSRRTGTVIEEIYKMKNNIEWSVEKNLPIIQNLSAEFMYLEKSHELQISLPNTISANTLTSKGHVLIHIIGETTGNFCNLPSYCLCPVQYTIEITPEYSVADLPTKGTQRIFSYDDKSMIIHFVTNSISRNSKCRTDTIKVMNEVSMMSWNTLSTKNSSGSFFQCNETFRGYISKVEFFTLNGKTYVIVGKYFDPVTETYDLECVVIRFNENRTSTRVIQKIPTKGVEELYLLHTAQGVLMIIGNIKPDEEETQIYLFNEVNEQFKLLRTIPTFGCSGATGVVFGTDSLIILRHRFAPLQILKYFHQFNNYYFYQSFDLEEPVIGVKVFYSAGFGISEAYMCLVTSNENYYIYTYKSIEGWKLVSNDHLKNMRNLFPLEFNNKIYLFAVSKNNSLLLTLIKNGSV